MCIETGKPVIPSGTARLVFTDWLYIAAVGVVLFWALNPFVLDLARHPVIRWFPLLLVVPAVALGWVGRRINAMTLSSHRQHDLLMLMWPLLAFGAMALAGSLYARWWRQIGETFMNMGLFVLLGGWVTAWFILTTKASLNFLRSLSVVALLWAAVSLFSALLLFPKEEIYHSLEHLVIPVLALPFLNMRGLTWRAASLLLPILAALALHKLTGYLILLLVLGLITGDFVLARMRREDRLHRRAAIGYGAVLGGALAAALVVGTYVATKSRLPDGNAVFRLHTYERAFDRFLESPIWGRMFLESAVDRFELFTVASSTQFLPTHSDWLDIMANGGLIATLLFFGGCIRLLWIAVRTLLDPEPWCRRDSLRVLCILHVMIVVTGLVVCALNPVLNNTSRAWAFWINVGILVAITVMARETCLDAKRAPDPYLLSRRT